MRIKLYSDQGFIEFNTTDVCILLKEKGIINKIYTVKIKQIFGHYTDYYREWHIPVWKFKKRENADKLRFCIANQINDDSTPVNIDVRLILEELYKDEPVVKNKMAENIVRLTHIIKTMFKME